MLRILIILYVALVSSSAISDEIPVIVISAGKTLQSKSIVGSDIEIVDSKTLKNSNEYFIGDILDKFGLSLTDIENNIWKLIWQIN